MKKRILLTAVALILVCALSIMGTVAFLQTQTATVTNTFVASGGGQLIDPDGEDNESGTDDDGAFILKEHEATKVKNGDVWTGMYEIKDDAKVVATLSYDIMPGMVIPKDPYVAIKAKTAVPAYLYIEVINNLSFSTKVNDVETLVIDGEHWIELAGVTGPSSGKVYVYTTDGIKPAIITADVKETNIIKDNKFTVNENVEPTQLDADETLKFNAFLAQASIGEETGAAAIFNACFGNQGGQGEAPTPDPNPVP